MRSILIALFTLTAIARAEVAVEIDLATQMAYVIEDYKLVAETPISSGRTSHTTPTGSFKVVEKDLDHRSSLYGRIVDANGEVLVRDADSATEVPEGGTFVQAPMRHFVRFDGAIGMHAGRLPGYAASHGCVRLPPEKARLIYNLVHVGTPVLVHGKAPSGHVKRDPAAKPELILLTPPPPPKREPFGWLHRIFAPREKASPGQQNKSAARENRTAL